MPGGTPHVQRRALADGLRPRLLAAKRRRGDSWDEIGEAMGGVVTGAALNNFANGSVPYRETLEAIREWLDKEEASVGATTEGRPHAAVFAAVRMRLPKEGSRVRAMAMTEMLDRLVDTGRLSPEDAAVSAREFGVADQYSEAEWDHVRTWIASNPQR